MIAVSCKGVRQVFLARVRRIVLLCCWSRRGVECLRFQWRTSGRRGQVLSLMSSIGLGANMMDQEIRGLDPIPLSPHPPPLRCRTSWTPGRPFSHLRSSLCWSALRAPPHLPSFSVPLPCHAVGDKGRKDTAEPDSRLRCCSSCPQQRRHVAKVPGRHRCAQQAPIQKVDNEPRGGLAPARSSSELCLTLRMGISALP